MEQDPKKKILSFEDLEVWKQARALRKRISSTCREFPKEKKYRLVDQLLRSSRSVTANIAEGYGRYHYQENIQYCRQARGSLYELLDHLVCAYDEGYIDSNLLKDLREDISQSGQLLNGYISYLHRAKKTPSSEEPNIYYDLPPDNE